MVLTTFPMSTVASCPKDLYLIFISVHAFVLEEMWNLFLILWLIPFTYFCSSINSVLFLFADPGLISDITTEYHVKHNITTSEAIKAQVKNLKTAIKYLSECT